MVKIGYKVWFGNKFANWCNVLSIEGVFVHGHVPECHVTFGCFYANLSQLVKQSNSVIRCRSLIRSIICVMPEQWLLSLYMVIIKNVVSRLINNLCTRISNVPLHTLPKKLIGKSHCSQNKTFRRWASPGVPDELWDENTIGGRRWDVAVQKREVCNIEIKIVTLVLKGSV